MRLLAIFALAVLLAPPLAGQVSIDTKALLEDYSRELFEANAEGFMSPLVIVSNVGANDAFYNRAYVPKKNSFYFEFSIRSMAAFVVDEERNFTSTLPLADTENPYHAVQEYEQWIRVVQLNYFKAQLREAARAGELETSVVTATVFGDEGSGFVIPKEYLAENVQGIDSTTLANLPSELSLTPGTNQDYVIAAVPQLTIGSYYSSEILLRYIPPIVFDVNLGKFSFFGVAVKHAFSNWFNDPLFDAAVQVGFQHSSIENEVGLTKARLEAETDLFAFNLHASKRFGIIEPYVGVSYETLSSEGSYTFTLPQNIKDEIGYDIDPQTVPVTLSDNAMKATFGLTAHLGPLQLFASAGLTKHLIFSAGIVYRFEP